MEQYSKVQRSVRVGIFSVAAFWLAACMLLPGLSGVTGQPRIVPGETVCAQEGCLAPNFILQPPLGDELELAQLRGQPVLINFWTTWCGFCAEEMPDLQDIHERYRQQGLVILGINHEESRAQVLAYVAEHDLTFTMLLDEDGEVGDTYQITAFPTSFFIDAQGVIQKLQVGRMRADEIVEILEGGLLAGVLDATAFAPGTPVARAATATLIPEVHVLGCVKVNSLRLRAGPGKAYMIAGGLSENDCRWFDGRNAEGTWVRLARDSRGKDGSRLWAAIEFLDLERSIEVLPVVDGP
ncbi:MAG: TlpA disulfide reductase family protein [Chloroflexota bacterium]